jgi:stage V sporulation protein D (sporulation-specific penicillin-binding protein)
MADRKKKKTSVIRQKFPKRMQKKLVLLFGTIILAFVFLIGKVTYINATNGEKYTKIVLDQQQYNSHVIPFKRGDILDRNGTVVATSERVYNVILDVYVMLAKEDEKEDKLAIAEVKEVVSECFGIEASAIDEAAEEKAGSRYCILKKKVTYAQAQSFEALKKETYVDEKGKKQKKYPRVSCVWLEEDYIRTYPYHTLASDVIGFTVAGNVGNAGIESSYTSILNGTDGREYG